MVISASASNSSPWLLLEAVGQQAMWMRMLRRTRGAKVSVNDVLPLWQGHARPVWWWRATRGK